MTSRAIDEASGTSREQTKRTATASQAVLVEFRCLGPKTERWVEQIHRLYGVSISLIHCRRSERNPSSILQLLDFEIGSAHLREVQHYLEQKGSARSSTLGGPDASHLLVWNETPIDPICVALFEANAFCLNCRLLGRIGNADTFPEDWRIAFPNRDAVSVFLDSEGLAIRDKLNLLHSGPFQTSVTLTGREREAIRVAIRTGYFESPRRTQLGGVASALGITRSSASALIRRGTTKLFRNLRL
jgi:hypothetical protein